MNNAALTTKNGDSLTLLSMFGVAATFFTVLLAARLIWEETVLTIEQGPQMVGWTIVHIFPFMFLAPLALAVWLLIAVIVLIALLIRRRRLSPFFWSTLAAGALVLGLFSVPGEFWQWAFIDCFAKSPYAADLMVDDAAAGYRTTVRRYLDHGVPVNARAHDGTTAVHAAAVGGNVDVLQLLVSRGADLNAVGSYGDSPLNAAIEMKHTAAIAFLTAHGARDIQHPKPVLPPADTTVTVDSRSN